jgi:hypothetical protein
LLRQRLLFRQPQEINWDSVITMAVTLPEITNTMESGMLAITTAMGMNIMLPAALTAVLSTACIGTMAVIVFQIQTRIRIQGTAILLHIRSVM